MSPPLANRSIGEIRMLGGRSCLDFVNTVHDRFAAEPEDYLTDVHRYLVWANRAGLLTPEELASLRRMEHRREVLGEVRRFREQLHAVLIAQIGRTRPPSSAVEALGLWIRRAWSDLQFDIDAPTRLSWRKSALDTRLPLKRVALCALDLLRGGEVERLKCCAAADQCGWIFYDETKNNGRRWCAMNTCGAAAKMRAYRDRRR